MDIRARIGDWHPWIDNGIVDNLYNATKNDILQEESNLIMSWAVITQDNAYLTSDGQSPFTTLKRINVLLSTISVTGSVDSHISQSIAIT